MGMVLAALLATAVSAGCGSQDGSAPSQQRDRASSPDAPDTGGYGSGTAPGEAGDDAAAGASEATPGDVIDEALSAREANDAARFATLVGQASATCADPAASQRLAEVALIADRWAQALADGRPKVQAVTEDQLADVDWAGLVAACGS